MFWVIISENSTRMFEFDLLDNKIIVSDLELLEESVDKAEEQEELVEL